MRIVVLRYRFIGDTLLTLPFLTALRAQHPTAEIDLWVGEDVAEVMRYCHAVDRVIAVEPRRLGFWTSVGQLRAGRYDRAYVLKRSFSSALMAFLAGIPQRIGFATEHRRGLLTHSVPYREKIHHEARCFLDCLGIPETADVPLTAALDLPDTLPVPTLPAARGPRIVLHATSSNPAKCWPRDSFVALAEQLITRDQAQIIFLGTPAERPFYAALTATLPRGCQEHVVNYCGQTTVLESMLLLKHHVDLVVANDSGMIHMAAAVKTPVVAIFGPMDPNQWRPLAQNVTVLTRPDLTCRPCRMKISCENTYPCLTQILPEQVLRACTPYLASWSGRISPGI